MGLEQKLKIFTDENLKKFEKKKTQSETGLKCVNQKSDVDKILKG